MTSIISAGQSISSIGKSMTAIARVEEHLATFMKKVIYYEKFFQRMGPNLPGGVVSTAGLIFQRCYEYRDEIRDELESTVAYVADAGRWVVGIGDWNSKMEKRLGQISELVLLTNTLLTEYAVTGQVGAEDARDELDAYLQLLSATVTLKKAPVNGTNATTSSGQRRVDGRPQTARANSNTFEEFSSEMTGLGNELSGAFSEMFGNKTLDRSASLGSVPQGSTQPDNDAMNPFATTYRRPVDPYAIAASSASSSVQSLPGVSAGRTMAVISSDTENSLSDGETPKSSMSPVSLGEYECLEIDSIPKYAAFRSSAQLAARRQYAASNGGSLAASMVSDGGRSASSEPSAEFHELFPLPPPSVQTSRSMSSLEKPTGPKKSTRPIMDMNYSYDLRCEEANNPFLSPNTPGPIVKSQETFAREFPASLMPRQEHSASPDASTVSTTPTSTMVSNAAATATTVGGGRTDAAWSTSSGDVTSIAKEPILTAMAPTPTLHPAVEYTHAQASTVLVSEELSNSQSWSENSAQAHGNGHYDETEALVAALAASVAEQQQQRGSDHEYDLFGCAKP